MLSLVKRDNNNLTNPFGLVETFLNEFENDFFKKDFFTEIPYKNSPKFNLVKGEKEDCLEMIVPGLAKEDLNISIEENRLSISGETKNKDKNSFSYFKFSKTIPLYENYDADKIEAKLENGILNLIMPLKSNRKKLKQINIK